MKKFRVVVNGNEYEVAIEELDETGSVQKPTAGAARPAPQPKSATPTPRATTPQTKQPKQPTTAAAGGAITAPMPGTILRANVAAGDSVSKGQTLLVLEAMKMENEIMAPSDGVVEQLNVAEGASVNTGDVLIILSA